MLKHIAINGKSIPVNFGIRVMVSTADALGITFDGLCKKMDVENPPIGEMLELIIKSGTVAMNEGARIEHLSGRYTEDDVVDMIDANPDLLPQLSSMITESMRAKDVGFMMAGAAKQPAASTKSKKSTAASL